VRAHGVTVCALALVGCGDDLRPVAHDAAVLPPMNDVAVDAPAALDAPRLVRVYGDIIQDAPIIGAVVTLEGPAVSSQPDANNEFYFDVPDGSRLIVQAPAGDTVLSMIRGVIAHDQLRVRNFYMLSHAEIDAASAALGVTFDPNTAIVEVDFRNAEIGGYGVTLDGGNGPLTPTFGVVVDANGDVQLGQRTLVGGDGSTLLLAGLPPGSASFSALVPPEATLPCQPRDATPLPLVAGAVTWFDFECGNGED